MYIIIIRRFDGKVELIIFSGIKINDIFDTIGLHGEILHWCKVEYKDIRNLLDKSDLYVITELTNWI